MHDQDALLSEKIDDLNLRLAALEKTLEPLKESLPILVEMAKTWSAAVVGRRFFTGLAMFIASVAGMGAAIMAFVNWIRHG